MEANKISDQNDNTARYKAFGKKLKKIEDDVKKDVQEQLEEGIESISTSPYLPEDLATYLLSLRREVKLPVSVLPSSLFRRPVFFGREDFFHRLASELISFGLSYQRVYLQPVRLAQLANLFHKHRPWWQCDIQDIENAINILVQGKIVQKTANGFLFEPLTMSTDVREFLLLINKGINDFGEISLKTIQTLVSWDRKKIITTMELLHNNQICIFNEKENLLFFPEFKKD